MVGDIGTLYGKECAGSDVQADILTVDSLGGNAVKHPLGEMETGGRRRDRAPDPGVKSLIALGVDGFRSPVQIRRNRNGSSKLQNAREGVAVPPGKLHYAGLAVSLDKISLQPHSGDNLV